MIKHDGRVDEARERPDLVEHHDDCGAVRLQMVERVDERDLRAGGVRNRHIHREHFDWR